MKKINLTISFAHVATLLALFLVMMVSSVEASSVIRSGETVSISEEQTIEGDFYSAAGKVNVSGSVEDDMISSGGQVALNGSVGGDVFIIGGQVDIYGTVGDDLRILAGEVIIAEPILGDVFVMGGAVTILSTASVAGDVVLFAGEATVEGSVGGNILGTVDVLRIDAPVAGDVDITVGQLTLGDQTTIDGSVQYVSNSLVIQSLNATVSGELVRNDPVLPMAKNSASSALVPILILLFSVLVWYWVSRRSLRRVVDRALVPSVRPFLMGFGVLFLAPIAVGILMVSMIGGVVALVLMFAYLLLVTLSLIGLTAVLGQLLMRAFNRPTNRLSLTTLIVGVLGVSLLLLLPIIGQVLLLVFMVLTLGAMTDLLIRPNLD